MTVGRIKIKIGGDITGLERSLNRAEFRLQKTGSRISALGSQLTTSITLPLVGLGIASVKIAGDLESLEMGMVSIMGSTKLASEELKKLRKEALKPGLNFEQAIKGSLRLQSIGVSADLARATLTSFGNALALVGGRGSDLDGVTLALAQIAAKGKIQAEEINQIAERVPQIRQALINAFGTADTEVLQKLGIGFEEFISKIIMQLNTLPKATSGIKNTMENTATALKLTAAKIGEKVFPIFKTLSDVLIKTLNVFLKLPDSIQSNIVKWALLAAAVGPVLSLLGGFKIILGAVIGNIGTMISVVRGGFLLLLGPIGLAITAIGTVAALILGDIGGARKILVDVVNYFISLYNTSFNVRLVLNSIVLIFKGLAETAILAFNILLTGFTAVKDTIKAILAGDFKQIGPILAKGFTDSAIQAKKSLIRIAKDIDTFNDNVIGKNYVSLISEKDLDNQINSLSKTLKNAKNKLFGDTAEENIDLGTTLNLDKDFDRNVKPLTPEKKEALRKKAEKEAEFFRKLKNDFIDMKLSDNGAADINTFIPSDLFKHVGRVKKAMMELKDLSVPKFIKGKDIVNFELFTKLAAKLRDHPELVTKTSEAFQALTESLTPLKQAFLSLGPAIGSSLEQGAKNFKQFGANVIQSIAEVIGALIKQVVATAILGAFIRNPVLGAALAPAIAGLAAGTFRTLVNVASPPKLAKGGAAFGETLAVIGDNPGASYDPELVAPASHVAKHIHDSVSKSIGGLKNIVNEKLESIFIEMDDIRIDGSDFVLGLARADVNYKKVTG